MKCLGGFEEEEQGCKIGVEVGVGVGVGVRVGVGIVRLISSSYGGGPSLSEEFCREGGLPAHGEDIKGG